MWQWITKKKISNIERSLDLSRDEMLEMARESLESDAACTLAFLTGKPCNLDNWLTGYPWTWRVTYD